MTAVALYWMDKTIFLAGGTSSRADDAELLARCLEGQAAALKEIYLRYRLSVFRIVARMVANSADQEEVTQEVFVQIFRSLNSFKGTAKLSTWIHRVAMNVILQHIRRKRSRIQLFLETDISDRASGELRGAEAANPEDVIVQKERQRAVKRALSNLSPKKRAAIVLHDFEGLQAKDISYIVGAPVLTVRTRIFYARKDFYRALANEPAFSGFHLEEEAKK
jgi:RNA polymerase sigma-70 factor (ECF subfamily)